MCVGRCISERSGEGERLRFDPFDDVAGGGPLVEDTVPRRSRVVVAAVVGVTSVPEGVPAVSAGV